MTIRKLLVLLGIMALVTIGVVFIRGQLQPAEESSTDTGHVTQTTLQITVEGSGAVEPEHSVNLTFGVAEAVQVVDVEVGDTVESGQILASLDTTDLGLQVAQAEQAVAVQQAAYDQLVNGATEYDIAQARAAVTQAQANLAAASNALALRQDQMTINCANLVITQDTLDTAQETYDAYVKAGFELDPLFMADPDSDAGRARRDAQTAFDSATAQCNMAKSQSQDNSAVDAAQGALEQAQSRLDGLVAGATQAQKDAASAQLAMAHIQLQQAQARLNDAQIVAPFSGLVVAVNIVPGQRVNTNTIAMTLVDNSLLHLDVAVDELDIPNVAVGQPVTVTLESLSDSSLSASVAQIMPAGYLNQGIVNYTVRVNLSDPQQGVMLGMSADVEILVNTLNNVLTVPCEAVQNDAEQGEYVLVQQPDGETQFVPVTTGQSVDGQIVVEGDLTAGETVLLSLSTTRRSFSLFGR